MQHLIYKLCFFIKMSPKYLKVVWLWEIFQYLNSIHIYARTLLYQRTWGNILCSIYITTRYKLGYILWCIMYRNENQPLADNPTRTPALFVTYAIWWEFIWGRTYRSVWFIISLFLYIWEPLFCLLMFALLQVFRLDNQSYL